ncbi:MAG: GAF domain-containing protein [Ignavibacteriales bacterium]
MKKAKSYDAIISAVTQSVHKSINLEEVLENTAQAIIKNIPKVKHISIYLVEGEEAVLKAYRGYPKWFIERVRRIPYPKGFTWKTIMDGKPRYCADVDKDEFIGPAGREAGTKSYVSMPIHFQNKTIGIIKYKFFQKKCLQ